MRIEASKTSMVKTPNHDYNIPSPGASDWHIPLNENFEQIDIDIEIRGPEAEKSQYEPEKGSKYEAIDTGAIYYGDGNTWILVNRKVDEIESNSSVTGEHLKAGDSSTAVVAPSVSSAFDGIQEALDAGFYDIILAEEITEAGIELPERQASNRNIQSDRIRISGVGDGTYQTIRDPGTHDYVIGCYQGDNGRSERVLIENIRFLPETDHSGYCILGAKKPFETGTTTLGSSNWTLRDIESKAGPLALYGPRNLLYSVDIENWSKRFLPVPGLESDDTGEIITDRYGAAIGGTTFGVHGGSFISKQPSRHGAYVSVGGWSITGGPTFANTNDELDSDYFSSNICFYGGCSRGFMGGMSTEGSCDYDIQMGLEDFSFLGDALSDVTIMTTSAFDSMNIQNTVSNVRVQAFQDVSIRKTVRANMEIISGDNVVVENTPNKFSAHEITHINPYAGIAYRVGGNKTSPPTTFGLKIHTQEPIDMADATFAVADGANWDPVGNGNAALVAVDADGTWTPVFEYSGSL